MSPRTVLRLAVAGSRTDTLRVVLTSVSAAFATVVMLLAATVLAIPGLATRNAEEDDLARQYRLQVLAEPGLRPGVAFALVLLTIPVLALAAQCARLGAPARERRLATIRLAGATPGQAILVAVAETGVACGLGSGAGLAGYLVGRKLLHRPDPYGTLLLPTDVLPRVWAMMAICVGLPLVATAFAAILLRHTVFTPYGVVRRTRTTAPSPLLGLPILVGVALIMVSQPAIRWADRAEWDIPGWFPPLVLFIGASAAALGVVLGTGWVSHTAGRILHRFGRGPTSLLAGRRLLADPWTGSRTFAVLLVCVLFGAGAAGVRAMFGAQFGLEADRSRWEAAAAGQPYRQDDKSFYFDTLNLVDGTVAVAVALAAAAMLVAIAEGIVSRRRAYASMVATGVPRGTLARAILVQTVAPVVPAVLIALTVGVSLIRSISPKVTSDAYAHTVCSADWSKCQDAASPYLTEVHVPAFERVVPIPLGELALLGGGTVLAVLVVVGIGLLFLRGATDLEELRAA